MAKSHLIIFSATILMALFSGPRTGEATQDKKAMPAAEEPVKCQKKFGTKGRPHRISTVATLTAVRAWSEYAKKYGKEYAIWNAAENGTIKCEKLERSDYYVCFASGKPCLDPALAATAAKKAL